jgi:acyl dehydratase
MPREDRATLFPKITDRGLENLRSRIGVKITDTLEPWCHEATRDAIRHYAHGIGDDNPLWCDPAYAAGTRWGGIIAPPSFLFATSRIISGYVGGLPGVHAMWAGADWRWHLPVRRGDEITTEAWLTGLIEHETTFAGRSIQQVYHVDFKNQRGELVADAESWCFRTDRDLAREEGTKYAGVKARAPKRYTDEELAETYRLYAQEEVRGATPRRWDDVREGERLPTMAKGPMTVTGFIAYAQGWGGLYIRANKLAWKQIHRHAGLGIKNRFGIPDCPERVHWEGEFATLVGAPSRTGWATTASCAARNRRSAATTPRATPSGSTARSSASSSTTAATSWRSPRKRASKTASSPSSAPPSWSCPPEPNDSRGTR